MDTKTADEYEAEIEVLEDKIICLEKQVSELSNARSMYGNAQMYIPSGGAMNQMVAEHRHAMARQQDLEQRYYRQAVAQQAAANPNTNLSTGGVLTYENLQDAATSIANRGGRGTPF